MQTICFDFDNQKASHTLSSTYQGNLKIYDSENSFYLSLEKMSLSYDSEKNAYTKSIHKEGYTEGNWILMDYGDCVAHIFRESERNFYNLEQLWADAPSEAYTETESEEA